MIFGEVGPTPTSDFRNERHEHSLKSKTIGLEVDLGLLWVALGYGADAPRLVDARCRAVCG